MTELKQAVLDYALQHIDDNNDWYDWKINEDLLPQGIELPEGNPFKLNIALKYALNEKWSQATTQQERLSLVKYYVATWGGIKGNKAEKLASYATLSADELIALKDAGIASWSKALVVQDAKKYAIYDTRVAMSLNCLQEVKQLSEKTLFPSLISRNTKIQPAIAKLKKLAQENEWIKANKKTFYEDYLSILTDVANELNTNIATIEMLLFAKAEDLVEQTFG